MDAALQSWPSGSSSNSEQPRWMATMVQRSHYLWTQCDHIAVKLHAIARPCHVVCEPLSDQALIGGHNVLKTARVVLDV